jgi:glycosyltransferase involved in cell wall biosynthesis
MAENRIKFYKKAGRLSSFTRPMIVHRPSEEKIISVIVRTKNRPHLLNRALTSLVNQTAQVFGVIVINDGGDDITTIIDEFKKFFPIKYIHHKESLGRTEAINSGLEIAKGNWIGYLDDDDILYPWHYEALLEHANQEQSNVVYSDYNRSLFTNIHAIEPQKLAGSPSWTFNLNELLVQNQIPIHSYIHRSEVLKIVKNWNVTFDRLEDYEFLLRVSSLGEFSHVGKVTCEYRFYLDTKNSISLEGRDKYLQALERIYQLYPVYDESLISHRIETISAMQEQNSQIVSIYNKFDNEELAQREVIRLVTGM